MSAGSSSIAGESSRKAFEGTYRILEWVAVLATIGFLIYALVSGQPAAVLVLSVLLAISLVLVLYLSLSRIALIERAATALRSAAAAQKESEALRLDSGRLKETEAILEARTKGFSELTAKFDALQSTATKLDQENAALKNELVGVKAERDRLQTSTQELTRAVQSERDSTQRAPYLPQLRPTVELVGFGILTSKTVRIKTENIGPGNARNIHVNALVGGPGRSDRLISVEFVPAMAHRERHYSVVGSLNDLPGVTFVEAQLYYESQFGACVPMGHRIDIVR